MKYWINTKGNDKLIAIDGKINWVRQKSVVTEIQNSKPNCLS